MSATLEGRGLRQCRVCRLVLCNVAAEARCPRCATLLHGPLDDTARRRSMRSTAALVIASLVLYIPSNLLPIMVSRSALGDRSDTIMSGAWLLLEEGSWHLALIVFVASVMVPLVKIGVLGYLLLAVRFGWPGSRRRRTAAYRLIETVGRWSMLDVFVVGLLAALVRLEPTASVDPGPGLLAFGTVVWLTLWATQAFDPRLIWHDKPALAAPPAKGTRVHV